MTEPRREPQSVYAPLITAIDNMVREQGETRRSIDGLSTAVLSEAAARDKKVHTLQRLTGIMIAGIAVLMVVAGLNLVNTTRTNGIARNAQATNELLLGCLTPGNTCSDLNARQTAEVLNQIRQTQLVIALCQRQNPAPQDATPAEANASAANIVKCVQTYYPDFALPAKQVK